MGQSADPFFMPGSFLPARECGAPHGFLINFRLKTDDILQNVKRAPREPRICGRKGRRWKIREFYAPERGQFANRKRLLLDKCTQQEAFVRKGKRGTSAIGSSFFLFAFSAEGVFLSQIGKQTGKSRPKSRLSERFLPE